MLCIGVYIITFVCTYIVILKMTIAVKADERTKRDNDGRTDTARRGRHASDSTATRPQVPSITRRPFSITHNYSSLRSYSRVRTHACAITVPEGASPPSVLYKRRASSRNQALILNGCTRADHHSHFAIATDNEDVYTRPT